MHTDPYNTSYNIISKLIQNYTATEYCQYNY